MHYNDIDHNRKLQYTTDRIQWREKDHKRKLDYTTDAIHWEDKDAKVAHHLKEEIYNPYQVIQIHHTPIYQEEEYTTREYGDLGFYKWLNEQNHHCVAILAEIVNAPKLNPIIESLRPKVKYMKTMTIDEYRKVKCIGTTKTEWLKQMKKKYGINILRFLFASI